MNIYDKMLDEVSRKREYPIKPCLSSDGALCIGTDGNIMFAVKAELTESEYDFQDKITNIEKVLFTTPRLAEPLKFPSAILSQLSAEQFADLTDGVDCETCKGSGRCYCECGDEHDCRKCDGIGTTGDVKKYLSLHGMRLSYLYLRMICKAAELLKKQEIEVIALPENNRDIAVFRVEQMEIALMQSRATDEQLIELQIESPAYAS